MKNKNKNKFYSLSKYQNSSISFFEFDRKNNVLKNYKLFSL